MKTQSRLPFALSHLSIAYGRVGKDVLQILDGAQFWDNVKKKVCSDRSMRVYLKKLNEACYEQPKSAFAT